MGDYELMNPLLYGVSSGYRPSLERFVKSVSSVFKSGGLELALLTPQHKGGIAWEVSDASPSYGIGNLKRRKEQMEKFRDVIAKAQGEDWLSVLTGGQSFFGGNANSTTILIEDDKLVVAFYVPGISRDAVNKLKGVMVDHGIAPRREYVIDGVSIDEPHLYLRADLSRDESRVAGRLVADPHYTEIKKEAIWFSTQPSKKREGHWLYDSKGVLVELRVDPAQEFLKLGQTVVEMGYILAGKQPPPRKQVYLDLWHSLMPSLIDQRLVTNIRLPSQQRVFNHILVNTVLPYLDPDYAARNMYRPYNAMVFGAKGVGKTMIAAMLAMQRFEDGVVVPMSQLALLDEKLSIITKMREASKRSGVKHIPMIEDLDKLASISSRNSPGEGILNSDLGNLLAGMGAERTVVIGTGNTPFLMDPNLLEPERLGGLMMQLGLPDAEERAILVRNVLEGRAIQGAADDLISWIVSKTEGYSQRMIVDVVNRATPAAAAARLNGQPPRDSDFRGRTEDISTQHIDEACAYAEELYQFGDLKENQKAINNFFSKLGHRGQTMGLLAGHGSSNGSKNRNGRGDGAIPVASSSQI